MYAFDWDMPTPPKHCHSPHMALQVWRTLIFGFWKSQDLVTESQTHLSSSETNRSSSWALHSPLMAGPRLLWGWHKLIARAGNPPKGIL